MFERTRRRRAAKTIESKKPVEAKLQALAVLSKATDDGAHRAVKTALADPGIDVAARAAEIVSGYPVARSVPVLESALKAAISSKDTKRTKIFASALASFDSDESFLCLAASLAICGASPRRDAVTRALNRQLRDFNDSAMPRLLSLLEENHSERTREYAAEAMLSYKNTWEFFDVARLCCDAAANTTVAGRSIIAGVERRLECCEQDLSWLRTLATSDRTDWCKLAAQAALIQAGHREWIPEAIQTIAAAVRSEKLLQGLVQDVIIEVSADAEPADRLTAKSMQVLFDMDSGLGRKQRLLLKAPAVLVRDEQSIAWLEGKLESSDEIGAAALLALLEMSPLSFRRHIEESLTCSMPRFCAVIKAIGQFDSCPEELLETICERLIEMPSAWRVVGEALSFHEPGALAVTLCRHVASFSSQSARDFLLPRCAKIEEQGMPGRGPLPWPSIDNDAAPDCLDTIGWPTVRVFISSTFIDMQAERDYLVSFVFPKLRETLRPFHIHLVDIDLRWGITEDECDSQGAAILCLQEIDRCRPFFVGLLGGRYGWVPESLPDPVDTDYGWLEGYEGSSLTELEILHGVLNESAASGHAFFYLRDPAVYDDIDDSRRGDYVESSTSASKLEKLKERIRASRASVYDGYPASWDSATNCLVNLGAFGDRVYDELLEAIREAHGLGDAPVLPTDPLVTESRYHSEFSELQTQVYVQRPALQAQLLSYIEGGHTAPCLLTGPEGAGKSTVLAYLAAAYLQSKPETVVVARFAEASPQARTLELLLRHVCQVLKHHFGYADEIQTSPSGIRTQFASFVSLVPSSRNLILFLDISDFLNDSDYDGWGQWLPPILQDNVRVIASCSFYPYDTVRSLRGIVGEGYVQVQVPPLSRSEQYDLANAIPLLSSKRLDSEQMAGIMDNPVASNALYMSVMLEELRGVGQHRKVLDRIQAFPYPGISADRLCLVGLDENVMSKADDQPLEGIYLQMLERLESSFGGVATESVLSLIAASRSGLSEAELVGICGDKSTYSILRQLRSHLWSRGELIVTSRQAMKNAVGTAYDLNWARRRLVEFFNDELRRNSSRALDEVPWQLAELEDWPALQELLSEPTYLSQLWDRGFDTVNYLWALLEAQGSVTAPDILGTEVREDREFSGKLAGLYDQLGHINEGAILAKQLIDPKRVQKDDCSATWFHTAYSIHAATLRRQGSPELALRCLSDFVANCAEAGSTEGVHCGLVNSVPLMIQLNYSMTRILEVLDKLEASCQKHGNLAPIAFILGLRASVLYRGGLYEEALSASKKQEAIARDNGSGTQITDAFDERARIEWKLGHTNEAHTLFRESERLKVIYGDVVGLQTTLTNWAVMLAEAGEYEEAEAACVRAEKICHYLGEKGLLPNILDTRATLAAEQGELEKALDLYRQEETLLRKAGFVEGLAYCLQNLMVTLAELGRTNECGILFDEANQVAMASQNKELISRMEKVRSSLEQGASDDVALRPDQDAVKAAFDGNYAELFRRMGDPDARSDACEVFRVQLKDDCDEALHAVLEWEGSCTGMTCNDFIFAIYDHWIDPLTPAVIWKLHCANGGLETLPEDELFALKPLAKVIAETIHKGHDNRLQSLRNATPPRASDHFNVMESSVRALCSKYPRPSGAGTTTSVVKSSG